MIRVIVDVVTGRVEVDGIDRWADDDPGWSIVDQPDGGYFDGVTLAPWGEEELDMHRADAALADYGLIRVGERQEAGSLLEASVTTDTEQRRQP